MTAARATDHDAERVLALVDEVIGLRAELAAQQYRHDLALWARAEENAALQVRLDAAEKRIDDLLASRSWRLGQALFRPAQAVRRKTH